MNYDKTQLNRIARKYRLKFIILHGSYATRRTHKGSDLDIAALAIKEMKFGQELKLYSELARIFGNNAKCELDFKVLNKVDPLFRYEVIQKGVLLYGNETAYEEFKAFACRAYEDTRDLRDLEKYLSQKYQLHLNAFVAKYA